MTLDSVTNTSRPSTEVRMFYLHECNTAALYLEEKKPLEKHSLVGPAARSVGGAVLPIGKHHHSPSPEEGAVGFSLELPVASPNTVRPAGRLLISRG